MILYSRLRLATKFALMLSIVLCSFFVIAAVLLDFYSANMSSTLVEIASKTDTEKLAEEIGRFTQNFQFSITLMMLVISIGVVITVYIIFLIMIRRRLNYMADRFRDVSEGEGDLQQRIAVKGNDGLDILSRLFNAFIERLQAMISEVVQSTQSLSEVAGHVTGIASKSTHEIEQQQGRLEQVATAMNEMATNAEKVAEHAQSAAGKASDAEQKTSEGMGIVTSTEQDIQHLASEITRANEVIQRLHSHGEEIGSIVLVISDIAEQTNLLALNAAIEAARAGEQGRGFAVVADEVRSLASRTQESTNEIKNMIERLQEGTNDAVQAMEASQERAKLGVEQSQITGQTLQSISISISEINQMNTEISQAISQQNQVARDIDMNITSINQSAHAAAEAARESLTESEQLAGLATHLQTLLGQFKV
ncbi:MAG: methyl-accepting chemotaxis protein [Gammaproteobacteria bacterium]|nr:methyl-accepting chemotaxis protein [Gammaproteobacteria bacterium]